MKGVIYLFGFQNLNKILVKKTKKKPGFPNSFGFFFIPVAPAGF